MKRSVALQVRILTVLFSLPVINYGNSAFTLEVGSPDVKVFSVYDEAENSDDHPWAPTGWMPDGSGIVFQNNYEENCHSGKTCIGLGYNPARNSWVGIYWLAYGEWTGPGINIYEELEVDSVSSAKLTFWARGDEGGERVQFKVGGVSDGDDSIEFAVETDWIQLGQDWKQYSIELSDQDLSNVVGGFCWVTNRAQNRGKQAVRLFLDDIRYELR